MFTDFLYMWVCKDVSPATHMVWFLAFLSIWSSLTSRKFSFSNSNLRTSTFITLHSNPLCPSLAEYFHSFTVTLSQTLNFVFLILWSICCLCSYFKKTSGPFLCCFFHLIGWITSLCKFNPYRMVSITYKGKLLPQ